jgi:hypothetical protein
MSEQTAIDRMSGEIEVVAQVILETAYPNNWDGDKRLASRLISALDCHRHERDKGRVQAVDQVEVKAEPAKAGGMTREEMIDAAVLYVRTGNLGRFEQMDAYHERLGLLVGFVVGAFEGQAEKGMAKP